MNPVIEAPVLDIVCRVQAEFTEMPGLKLTISQAQKLWGLDRSTCERVIDRLTMSGFLVRTPDDAVIARGG
jgi:Fic family protein